MPLRMFTDIRRSGLSDSKMPALAHIRRSLILANHICCRGVEILYISFVYLTTGVGTRRSNNLQTSMSVICALPL